MKLQPQNARSAYNDPPRPCEHAAPIVIVPSPADHVTGEQPRCIQPTCRKAAEWTLPPGATLRNTDDSMHFCGEHLTAFADRIGQFDGHFARAQAMKEAAPAHLQYREVVSHRHAEQVLEVFLELVRVTSEESASELELARGATLRLLGKLRDPKRLELR